MRKKKSILSRSINKESGWVEKSIRIVTDTGEECKGMAKTLGCLSIYIGVGKEQEKIILRHDPSMWRITTVLSEDDAKKMGEVLLENCQAALRETDGKKILDKFPGWVVKWVKDCCKARKFLPVPEQEDAS